jgi:HTH-type transcriptional regulator/antitoxin HipB
VNVRERRLALGLSQVELAARAGMTQPALSRLEAGGVIPTIPLLDRISIARCVGTAEKSLLRPRRCR